jgi:hypothetical protein
MPKKGDRHRAPRQDTMKCVRTTYAPFKILRLPNKKAGKEVAGGMARYVPKKDWKAQRAEQKKAA